MSDQTAAELEREAELARARIADTADSLRSKMTPGQMVDEVTSYFRSSNGGLAFGNLAGQLRDNPIPAALVGIGLAWLFASGSSGQGSTKRASARTGPFSWDDADASEDDDYANFGEPRRGPGYAQTAAAAGSTAADAISSAASGIGSAFRSTVAGAGSALHGANSALHGAGSALGEAADLAAGAAGSVAAGVSASASGLGGAARSAAQKGSQATRTVASGSKRVGGIAQKQFTDILAQEPLILAALGVAVGAAIGAAFPSTSLEDEAVGAYSDKLREKVGETASSAMEQASGLATEAYSNLKDAARDSGLGDQGVALADSLTHVLQDTVQSVQDAVHDKLGNVVGQDGPDGEDGGDRQRSNPV